MENYLPFEEPIKIIDEEIVKVQGVEANSGVDSSKLIKDLEKKKTQTIKDIFKELTPWQRVQLSRHPDRPYSLDY
ncbi:MAG: acetyl-CoA carboxylase carboxyl transferase subunit alpha, partial [Putridiphycobacter sp.]|nr:acetyl-CoA carboxylase carboxyl transferase subunit alpha [Putridiphycobacter sp.]